MDRAGPHRNLGWKEKSEPMAPPPPQTQKKERLEGARLELWGPTGMVGDEPESCARPRSHREQMPGPRI